MRVRAPAPLSVTQMHVQERLQSHRIVSMITHVRDFDRSRGVVNQSASRSAIPQPPPQRAMSPGPRGPVDCSSGRHPGCSFPTWVQSSRTHPRSSARTAFSVRIRRWCTAAEAGAPRSPRRARRAERRYCGGSAPHGTAFTGAGRTRRRPQHRSPHTATARQPHQGRTDMHGRLRMTTIRDQPSGDRPPRGAATRHERSPHATPPRSARRWSP
jgi:hypothetical protein